METAYASVNRAFSKQSSHYDEDDRQNPVLVQMRSQIYDHLSRHLSANSRILELNAGTGIDATHLAKQGHVVHAIDIAEGMISQIERKIIADQLHGRLSCEQISYEDLDSLSIEKVDHIFSNFGGLNCEKDLAVVATNFHKLLKENGLVTLVIMPPVCLWELLSVFKGRFKRAFRRFHKNGVMAHVEGEYFKTYYHSLNSISKALGPKFELVECEGLACVGPQPHRSDFPEKYPRLYNALMNLDQTLRHRFPFNRWGDHIIVTFKYNP